MSSTTPPQDGDDKRIPVGTAQDENLPGIAASASEHAQMPAQIHATPPKPDQELPLPLPPKGVLPVPSTTPPQEGDDKRIPVATSIAQDEDMPAASAASGLCRSRAVRLKS